MRHIELGVFVYDVLILLVGYAALYGLGATGLRPPDLRHAGLAFITGWAVMGTTLSLGLLAGFDPTVGHFVGLAAVLAFAFALAHRRTPAVELLRPSGRRPRWPRAGTARVICIGGLGLAELMVVGALVVHYGATGTSAVIAAAAAAATGALARHREIARFLRDDPSRLLAGLAVAAGAALLVLAAVAAVILAVKGEWPSEWDAWGFWVPKGETIYYWHGLDTGIGGWGQISHPEYPPLIAVMYAASWHFAGGFHPSVLPLQQTLLAIGFVGAVLVLVDRFVPRWISFPSLALLSVTPGFWGRTQTLMADPPLAYMVALAAVAGLLWLSTDRAYWLAFGALFLAAGALTKLEGLSLGLLLVLTLVASAVARRGRHGLRGLILLAGPAAVEPWRLWLASHHFRTSSSDYHLTEVLHPLFLYHRIPRLDAALDWLVHSLFRTSVWPLVLPLALVALVLAARRAPAVAASVASWLTLGFFGLATIYWIGLPGLQYYLGASADRVASTLVIVAGAALPLLLGLSLGEAPAEPAPATVREHPAVAPG